MLRRLFGWGDKKLVTPPDKEVVVAGPAAEPVDVNDEDFDTVVLQTDKLLVVVDFWADWCQPCDTVSTYTNLLAHEYADRVLVAAVDVDANSATPARYAVMGLPTLVFVRDGVEVGRHVGVLTYRQLVTQVETYLAAPPA